jgi:hypothetical protein
MKKVTVIVFQIWLLVSLYLWGGLAGMYYGQCEKPASNYMTFEMAIASLLWPGAVVWSIWHHPDPKILSDRSWCDK